MLWSFDIFDRKIHNRDQFDCGVVELNAYLKEKISPDIKMNMGRAIVACAENTNQVLGFYTLSMGQISWDSLPSGYNKIPRYPVPVARIGRLAVDLSVQGQGLGKELLSHAHLNVLKANNIVAVYAVIVDAKNKNAEKFYLKYGYRYLQQDRPVSTLFIPTKEISSSFDL